MTREEQEGPSLFYSYNSTCLGGKFKHMCTGVCVCMFVSVVEVEEREWRLYAP